jgi:hypothetical protein
MNTIFRTANLAANSCEVVEMNAFDIGRNNSL